MKYILIIAALLISIGAFPRKIRQKHAINKNSSAYVSAMRTDTILTEKYSIYVSYRDSIPTQWELHGSSHGVMSDSDPRTWPVFFNPRAPKYFHSQFDCKKIGEYRKLQEIPIEEFLNSHKETLLCPECIAKFRGYFLVTQILLGE